MTTTTSISPAMSTSDRPRRAAAAALGTAVVAICLKLPQALVGLLVPDGIPGVSPQVPATAPVVITLVWVLFSVALLVLRRWLGALSAAWFCLVSGVSGARLLMSGYVAWGAWQTATAVIALVALVTAAVRGAFSGSRW